MELTSLNADASSGNAQWQLRMEKEMRIAELTALIDAFTGGEFSRRMTELSAAQQQEKLNNQN